MRVTLPLLRIQPARAPILRYGVAVLSTTLALIPALLLPNVTESRLAVFAVSLGLELAPEVVFHPSVIERFARAALGDYAGFIVGWSDWISTAGSFAAVSIVFG